MPPDPARAEAVFLAAAAIPDPAARVRHVEAACAGDDGLKARVLALLAAHDGPDSLLDRPVPDPDHAATRDHRSSAAPAGDGVTRTQGGPPADPDEALSYLAPPGRPDALGRVGHYDVLEVLGRGGFGIVFRAFDEVLQRVVAVKVLAPQLAATSPARKRFVREARSAAAVRHENVVQVYEVAEAPLPYLTMEFIPGETLQQRLDRTGPLDASEVLRVGRQAADGLAAAHDQGLVHRDIKPGNILIESGPRGRVKLTDFGLARAADDASISQSGIVAGTPMYMAPEQARGETLDHRADLFSLGSVLYALVAGHPPFRAGNTPAVLKRVCEDTPRPLTDVIPEVPAWLCRIVEKLHAKAPADRYQTAREVAEVLADCERQVAAHGGLRDYSRIPGGKPSRRRWAAVAAAAALVPLLAWGVYTQNRPPAGVADPAPADPPPLAVAPFDAAQAKAHQEAWARHAGVPVEITGPVGMRMRLVPPGDFLMGTPEADLPARREELKLHGDYWVKLLEAESPPQPVRLTRPYRIGATEVTRGQFRRFVQATGYKTGVERGECTGEKAADGKLVRDAKATWDADLGFPATDDHPVTNVTWHDAAAYCAWLSKETGQAYRLPTEAEWEYAGRAGATSRYFYGNAFDPTYHWPVEEVGLDGTAPGPRPVGGKRPNAFGLHDVHDNVAEWCQDWYTPFGEPVVRPDPTGPPTGNCRVVRGSMWFYGTKVHSCSGRYGHPASAARVGFGFRVVLVVDPPPADPPPAVRPFDATQAKPDQEAWARHAGVPVEITDPVGMRMRLVPPGDFLMGTPEGDLKPLKAGAQADWVRLLDAESPPQPVRLTRPYRIGATEVTRGQFRRFVQASGYMTDVERGAATGSALGKAGEGLRGREYTWDAEIGIAATDDHPVVNVTWYDARAYCAWLSGETGRTYRLPTEAEWEFACRAGTTTSFSTGDVAYDTSHWLPAEVGSGSRQPGSRPVAGKRPNGFGLYDVHGNVFEWVQDYFAPFTPSGLRTDPTGPAEGTMRVRRSGSWSVSSNAQRSASRHEFQPRLASGDLGFRVVMVGDLSAPPTGAGPKP